MKNENGQEVVRRLCRGKHIDAECEARKCKNAQYGCVIQELKKKKKTRAASELF